MIAVHETIRDEARIPPNILVMEDEPNVARGLKMVLSEEGYDVDLAFTGQAALDSFSAKPFDLLVADLRLPDIDGIDVIRLVKDKWPETIVVVITGYASVSSAVDAMKLGTYDYLPKPFTEDEIKNTIDGALKGRQAIPSEEVLEKVEKSEEEKLIQKQEVLRILKRTTQDDKFWRALMETGSTALKSYRLSSEAKAALVSGDVNWISRNVGDLPPSYRIFLLKRLEREVW